MVQQAGTRDVKMPVPPESCGRAFPDDHGIMVFSSRVLGSVSRNLSLTKGLEPGHHDRRRARGDSHSQTGRGGKGGTPRKKRYSNSKIIESWTKKVKK